MHILLLGRHDMTYQQPALRETIDRDTASSFKKKKKKEELNSTQHAHNMHNV